MNIKDQITVALVKATGLKREDVDVESTKNDTFGDYSTNAAMFLYREFAKSTDSHVAGGKKPGIIWVHRPGRPWNNPREVADEIKQRLDENESLFNIVEKTEVINGFINFWLKTDVLVDNLMQIETDKENFGKTKSLKDKTWEIEHTSPNPNKAMHLGHLRNNVTGMAISNIAEALGAKVIRDEVDNDRGIAIAKLMWGYLKYAKKENKAKTEIEYWYDHQDEWQTPADLKMRPDRFVDMLYVKGSTDFESGEDIEKLVRQFVVDWENGEEKNRALWKKVLSYSYEGQEMTLKRLGNKWDYVWHESDHYQKGKDMVELGLKKGIFKKSEGAIVTDLSEYNLPDTVVIKKDGTALYITQDLALTSLKKQKFNADRMFWVIGPEQSLAMQQMFAVCEQLGIGKREDFVHLAYGYMSIKGQGKMSSRHGNVIYIDDLLDLAKEGVKKMMKKDDFTGEEIEKISEIVGVGAVKYSILKVGRLQDVAFDLNESVSLEGNSGPYLQYTVARCNSVIQKASTFKGGTLQGVYSNLNEEELLVLRSLIRFPEVVVASATLYSPNLLCNYLYDLAQKYNSFYNKFRILGIEDKSAESFRLLLTSGVGQVLKNGLKFLGIGTPEKM